MVHAEFEPRVDLSMGRKIIEIPRVDRSVERKIIEIHRVDLSMDVLCKWMRCVSRCVYVSR